LGNDPTEFALIDPQCTNIGRIDLSENGFDYFIKSKPIGPHEAIEKWMFFKSGLTASDIFQITQFKMTIIDSSGKGYVLFSEFLPKHFAEGAFKFLRNEPCPANLREEPNPIVIPTPELIRPEVTKKPAPLPAKAVKPPIGTKSAITIQASIINPVMPSIIVENTSDKVAQGVIWELAVFRARDLVFVSLPTQNIGFIKPHSRSAPYEMFSPGIPIFTKNGSVAQFVGNLRR
jgi:hypothetical protein